MQFKAICTFFVAFCLSARMIQMSFSGKNNHEQGWRRDRCGCRSLGSRKGCGESQDKAPKKGVV